MVKEVESLFPDGETVRQLRLTKEGGQLRIEVLEGPGLGDLSPVVGVNEALALNGWEQYIALKWEDATRE